MPLNIDENVPMPTFRSDLVLHEGPMEEDGSPTWNIFDPVKGSFFRISWLESLVFRLFKPGMTLNELAKEIEAHSTIKITPLELKQFYEQAYKLGLLNVMKSSIVLQQESVSESQSIFKKFLYNYLFFRIPILKPDEFLKKTLPYVKVLVSPIMLTIYFILSAIGITLAILNFETYTSTFLYFFNFYGLLAFLGALIFIKFMHEFAHAYTAANYNIHIANMGIAWIIMTPAFYTDATDAWKISTPAKRMAVSGAGVMTELVIAGLCTFGWAVTSPGIFNSIFYIVSSATWITSLIMNINPAMRFDGYHLLCDYTGIYNLQARSFTLTVWVIRKYLLGMNLPPPEENLTKKRMVGMTIYSIYTWAYRIFIYTGIALFIYHFFTKILGIFLFFTEIVLLIINPIYREIKEIMNLKSYLKFNKNLLITVLLISIFLIWFVVPFPHGTRLTAITIPIDSETIYAPEASSIDKIFIKRGDSVQKEQNLIKLKSKELNYNLAIFQMSKKVVEQEIYRMGLTNKYQVLIEAKKKELAAINQQLLRLEKQLDSLVIQANIAGMVIDWNDDLKEGQSVFKGQLFGKIATGSGIMVMGFAPEKYLEVISAGQKVEFTPENAEETFKGHIQIVIPSRIEYLQFPSLASTNKGPFAVNENPQTPELQYEMLESYFPVLVNLDEKAINLKYGEQGTLYVYGRRSSHLMNTFRWIYRIFQRESGF